MTYAFVVLCLGGVGCDQARPVKSGSTVGEEHVTTARGVGGLDASWSDPARCLGCHFEGTTVEAWDLARVYPEWVLLDAVRATEPKGKKGWGVVNPIQSTAVEWLVWQQLVAKDSSDRGKTCVGCHTRKEPRLVGDVKGIAADATDGETWREFHRWMGVEDELLHDTLGLWLSAETSRSVVVATVKVMNYGAGHRTPSGLGHQVVLEVAARGGKEWGDLELIKGVRIGEEGGRARFGKPGTVYGRTYEGPSRARSAVAQGAVAVHSDTRLQGGEHDEFSFVFVLPESKRDSGEGWEVEARLVHRIVGIHGERSARVIEREAIRF